MTGNPTLRRLMRAWFGDGRGTNAVAFRRDYQALARRVGPFDESLVRFAAGVVILAIEFETVTAELRTAQAKRATGKGRKPSTARITSLRKRHGLAWASYDSALRRLQELTRAPRHGRLANYLESKP